MVPALKGADVLGTYSGLRPATEHRDYQIVPHPGHNWVTVAGIRSTGLTASSGIAEYVASLYEPMLRGCAPGAGEGEGEASVQGVAGEGSGGYRTQWSPGQDRDAEWLLGVTEAATKLVPLDARVSVQNPPIPSLAVLAAEYQARGDGMVTLFGKEWRVAHPIASFGLESRNLETR